MLIIVTPVTGKGCQGGNMDMDTGSVIVIVGGWFAIGFLVALVLGKILREANSQRYHPRERESNVLVRYFPKLRGQGTMPTKPRKKDSKRATA